MSEKIYSGETMKGISQDSVDAINDYLNGVLHREQGEDEGEEVIQGSDTLFPLTGIASDQYDALQIAVAEILNDSEGEDSFTVAIAMAEGQPDMLIVSLK